MWNDATEVLFYSCLDYFVPFQPFVNTQQVMSAMSEDLKWMLWLGLKVLIEHVVSCLPLQRVSEGALSPDGTVLATASHDGYIKFWQIYIEGGQDKPR